ncbi:MAG: SDR family oxidoreductase [Gammaproteobacteria bacterium]|nr:SDR family oxidoreductase [Gammaproteobacteria bacterium]
MSELSAHFDSLFRLDGKVAVVTGGSRGIGKAACIALAAAGAAVMVSSRKLEPCEAVAEQIRQMGGDAQAYACNISDPAQIEALVAATESRLGPVDVLVANAAVNPHYGPLLDIGESAFDKIIDANLKGALHLSRRVIPDMANRGSGSVIFTSSIGGLLGSRTIGAYNISKAALMQLARNLALEWGERGVRVNTIAPGLVRTDFARALYENPDKYQRAVQTYPIGRLGEPDDIAGAFVFLAAEAGRFVTGQTLVVDGGTTIYSVE